MITFNEFVEYKRLEGVVTECANMMVEMDVEPHRYIYECLKEQDPVLAESWWDGVKNFAGNVWQGAKQFGSNVMQGVKAGYNQASDTISGPTAKFDAAVRDLEDLQKVLSNGEFANFMSSTGRGTVGEYIKVVKDSLLKDKQNMPQRTDTKVSQSYDTRQNVANQRAQVADGQQTTRQSSVLGPDGAPMSVPA